jgi:hypothetical protein
MQEGKSGVDLFVAGRLGVVGVGAFHRGGIILLGRVGLQAGRPNL